MIRPRSGSDTGVKLLRLQGPTRRPLGLGGVRRLEGALGRSLRRKEPGRQAEGENEKVHCAQSRKIFHCMEGRDHLSSNSSSLARLSLIRCAAACSASL
jgi:hypothetical protein